MTSPHDSAFRRCLVEADVPGIMKLWVHVAPHLANQSPRDALLALHIARCDAKTIPVRLKEWSRAFLADQGIQKIDGVWVAGLPKPTLVAEAVGISSRTISNRVLPFNRKVMVSMEDALLNTRAKGITEAPMQKEAMLKARARVRFKARVD